jgi:hypothetical protein
MELFGRSSGYYLFWTGFVYFWVGMYFAFTHYALPEIATLGFVLALSVPLWCPPVARHFNMEPLMFDWFKKKEYSNVVKFPEPKAVPDTPYITPPEPEKPAKIFYRIGVTDNNRVAFSMGMSEITMTKLGCQQMIEQLEVFMNQLPDEQCQDEE